MFEIADEIPPLFGMQHVHGSFVNLTLVML